MWLLTVFLLCFISLLEVFFPAVGKLSACSEVFQLLNMNEQLHSSPFLLLEKSVCKYYSVDNVVS